ncbi:hypothetical protein Dimus_017588, partial [Dionaea muscipula]
KRLKKGALDYKLLGRRPTAARPRSKRVRARGPLLSRLIPPAWHTHSRLHLEVFQDSLVVEGLSAISVISLDTVHLNALSRTKDIHSVRDPWPQGNRVKYRSSAFSVVNQATPDVVDPRGLELRIG